MKRTETLTPQRVVSWRLLLTGAGEPAWNMALDEALLCCHREGDPPLIRFYQWSPPAISLGRFQPAEEVSAPEGVGVVRRLTGGAAIYHRSDELTYSLVAPYSLFSSPRPRVAYQAIHRAIAQGLGGLGLEPGGRTSGDIARPHGYCYDQATDYDLVVRGRKLVGSAQRRQGRVFLQHGSLPRSADPNIAGAVSLAELFAQPPTLSQLIGALVEAFGRAFGPMVPAEPREEELSQARRLVGERYGKRDWTQRS